MGQQWKSLFVFGVSSFLGAQAQPSAKDIFERRVLEDGRVVYFADDVELPAGHKILVDEPASLHLKSLDLGAGAGFETLGNDFSILATETVKSDQGVIEGSFDRTINTAGVDGEDGLHGPKALDALKGAQGVDGVHGGDGANGGDGADIQIITPILEGNLTLISRGGDGGRGGSGGHGGKGGEGFSGSDARVLYNFRGMSGIPLEQLVEIGALIGVPAVGQVLAILSLFNGLTIGDGFDGFDGGHGGAGGNAGRGGNGGNAGSIELIFGKQIHGTKILVNARGGKAGISGVAGLGGLGGVGGQGGKRGDIFARDGKPGKSGLPGARGAAASAGKPGKSGRVRATQTDDPGWVKCYVLYRELIDQGEERSVAIEFLKSCNPS